MEDPGSLWHEVKKLIAVRKRHEALQSDSPIEFLYAKPGECPLAYRRGRGADAISVVLNPSDRPVSFAMEGLGGGDAQTVCFTGRQPGLGDGAVALGPCSGVFLRGI
jgi:maltose alpha-D-glucosyltransferase/alpha-amylase